MDWMGLKWGGVEEGRGWKRIDIRPGSLCFQMRDCKDWRI